MTNKKKALPKFKKGDTVILIRPLTSLDSGHDTCAVQSGSLATVLQGINQFAVEVQWGCGSIDKMKKSCFELVEGSKSKTKSIVKKPLKKKAKKKAIQMSCDCDECTGVYRVESKPPKSKSIGSRSRVNPKKKQLLLDHSSRRITMPKSVEFFGATKDDKAFSDPRLRRRRCLCFSNSEAPAWTRLFNDIKTYYETDALLAEMLPFGEQPTTLCAVSAISNIGEEAASKIDWSKRSFVGLDDSLWIVWRKLQVDNEMSVARLDRVFKIYLMRAIMGELRHAKNCTDDSLWLRNVVDGFGAPREIVQGYRMSPCTCAHCALKCSCVSLGIPCSEKACNGLMQVSRERNTAQISWWVPCPVCEPERTMEALAVAYVVFAWPMWSSSYGGAKWAHIVETLMGRVSASAPPPSWFEDIVIDEVDLAFYQKPYLFVDHALDLQHNGGYVFDKGWLSVDTDKLKLFQDLKTSRKVDVWGKMYIDARIRLRGRLGI